MLLALQCGPSQLLEARARAKRAAEKTPLLGSRSPVSLGSLPPLSSPLLSSFPSQPATVACKNGSSVGTRTRRMHVFCTFGAGLHAQVGAYQQKFLHRSSVGRIVKVASLVGSPLLIRACCLWLVEGGRKKKKRKDLFGTWLATLRLLLTHEHIVCVCVCVCVASPCRGGADGSEL